MVSMKLKYVFNIFFKNCKRYKFVEIINRIEHKRNKIFVSQAMINYFQKLRINSLEIQ